MQKNATHTNATGSTTTHKFNTEKYYTSTAPMQKNTQKTTSNELIIRNVLLVRWVWTTKLLLAALPSAGGDFQRLCDKSAVPALLIPSLGNFGLKPVDIQLSPHVHTPSSFVPYWYVQVSAYFGLLIIWYHTPVNHHTWLNHDVLQTLHRHICRIT